MVSFSRLDGQVTSTSPSNKASNIKVTILLNGGHQYQLFLERESTLLKQLAFAMAAKTQPGISAELIQIPVEQGRASLCFSSADLMGLLSDPPVVLQHSEQNGIGQNGDNLNGNGQRSSTLSSNTAQIEIDRESQFSTQVQTQIQTSSPVGSTQDLSILNALKEPLQPTRAVAPGVLPSKYYLAENFLDSQEHQQLLDYVLQRESNFVSASTTTGDADYRQSLVLHQFPPFSTKFRQKIRQHLPELLPALDLDPFEASEIEAQLTAHNDGNYFKLHNDNGSPETATRVLTYVYYFYRQPKPFTGGELKIYDSKVENGFYVAADSSCLIEPHNNSIIFFLSRYMHEVLPVSCPSQAFEDSRFTVNGWVRH